MQTWAARFTVALSQHLGRRKPVGSSKQSRGLGKDLDSRRQKLAHEEHFQGAQAVLHSDDQAAVRSREHQRLIASGNSDSRTHRLRGEGFMICETRGSKVERQTNEESTTAYCQSEYQLRIGAVSLSDCMPTRAATPILRSTTLTAQARDRTQCQCPFRSPPVRVMSNASALTYMERHRCHGC